MGLFRQEQYRLVGGFAQELRGAKRPRDRELFQGAKGSMYYVTDNGTRYYPQRWLKEGHPEPEPVPEPVRTVAAAPSARPGAKSAATGRAGTKKAPRGEDPDSAAEASASVPAGAGGEQLPEATNLSY